MSGYVLDDFDDIEWKHSLALWAQFSGIKVDGFPFSFKGHEYLFPLFFDTSPQMVWMKSAQMGATIWMTLRAFHQALFPSAWGFGIPIKVGFYFPGNDGVHMLVKGRVEPIMKNSVDLIPFSRERSHQIKPINDSYVYFFYIGGKSAKDSTPLMSAFFDEVRLMDLKDIDQARERVAHSPIEYIQLVSTAGYPQCFTGETTVVSRRIGHAESLSRPIKDFYTDGHDGWEVLSYDKKIQEFVWKKVLDSSFSGYAKVVEVSFQNGTSVCCTREHLFSLCDLSDPSSFHWKEIAEFSQDAVAHDMIRTTNRNMSGKYFSSTYVKNLQRLQGTHEVYDLEVADTSCFVLAESGCLVHNSDIHKAFLNSDQKWFTTVCDRCGCEQILCLDFPDCIAEHTSGTKRGQTYYMCKKCGGEILDTQSGYYVAHGDPDHRISGYQVSQLLSTRKGAKELITAYRDSVNKKEFYNSKLGIPFIDQENRPVTQDMLDNNVNPMLEWGEDIGREHFMGVDQMSGLNYITIVSKGSLDRSRRLVWFEIIDDRDPFRRTAQLMEDFSIKVCVCDAEPNANDAIRFANEFGERVFLAKYGDYGHGEISRWDDSWKPKAPLKRIDSSTYHQYRVFIDRFKSIEATLLMVADRRVEWPDPEGLIQEAVPYDGGRCERMPIMQTHGYPMLASAVKEKKDVDEKASIYKWKWVFMGMDAHFTHSLNYALRASERIDTSTFLWTV